MSYHFSQMFSTYRMYEWSRQQYPLEFNCFSRSIGVTPMDTLRVKHNSDTDP
ncbi:MAG: hypothetical protein N3F08_03230 [Crenarchaeota archaeon]|nr:hypothetical protein [Thermoproteota archaeon]